MSFVPCPPECDFSFENLPYGVFSTEKNPDRRIGVAIGSHVLDLKALASLGLFTGNVAAGCEVFSHQVLNKFMATDASFWKETRQQLRSLLSKNNQTLQGKLQNRVLIPQSEVTMHMPVDIGDYTDFYSSLHHASNVGSMFRDPSNPLPPNWKYLPIGYHGRASSVILSGTPIHRPRGQICPVDGQPPIFDASKLMDFELEVGFFIGGTESQLGKPLTMQQAEKSIFGFVLVNDWSARDIQKWEYFPLGPFNSKNLGTTISPWVVPLEALKPFVTANTPQDPVPFPYLRHDDSFNFDVNLTVTLKTETCETVISKSNFKHLYWTPKQQVVHHTTTGCPLRAGDLLASGTISGPSPDSYGCLLELSWRGSRPITLSDGSTRKFLLDNDEIIMKGYAENELGRIGFGECRGKLLPCLQN